MQATRIPAVHLERTGPGLWPGRWPQRHGLASGTATGIPWSRCLHFFSAPNPGACLDQGNRIAFNCPWEANGGISEAACEYSHQWPHSHGGHKKEGKVYQTHTAC